MFTPVLEAALLQPCLVTQAIHLSKEISAWKSSAQPTVDGMFQTAKPEELKAWQVEAKTSTSKEKNT